MDDNTGLIAFEIFSKPPKPRNSIQLSLEEETSEIAQSDGVDHFVFNILTIIIMHGVEILFGHRNILRLTEKNFNLLQEYTNSFGYKIHKHVDIDSQLLTINFEKIY